ncbi:MAG: cupin domain-containing protein [Halioglobus sp.]
MKKLPMENLSSVKMRRIGNGKDFSASVGRLTEKLGMEQMGMSVVELKPGEKAWPYHLHYGEEELFIIVAGSGTVRYDGSEHKIVEGDVVFTPPGEGTAHQIINTSTETLRYLALSTSNDPSFCYYPDSGKYATYTQKEDGEWKAFIAHESDHRDYYEGETDTD